MRLIDEKSSNNRWIGVEWPSKKQAGRTTTTVIPVILRHAQQNEAVRSIMCLLGVSYSRQTLGLFFKARYGW